MATLAAYAAHESRSAGRQHTLSDETANHYTEYQRDCARIIQCGAFRRLEGKTRLLVEPESDSLRSRLTHVLAVAQLGRHLARALRLNEDLVEAIALAYDLGHAPFGQAGRDSLQHCMQPYGGFEHSLQSLRIVDELEEHYPLFRGLNLTFETREGILKQCTQKQAKLLGSLGSRFLRDGPPGLPSLEAQIVELCDEIATNQHDIEDGLRARLVSIRQLREHEIFDQHYALVTKQLPTVSQRRVIYETLRRLLSEQLNNVMTTSHAQLEAIQPKSIDEVRLTDEPLINFSATMYEKHLELKQFLRTQVYQHYRVRRLAFKAQQIIRRLFDAFNKDPYLLPLETQMEVQRLQSQLGGDLGRARAVADYLASMTDRYAMAEYERLFNLGNLF